ncbi:MAG: sigma-70 region 4 domain-containing protein, partial [Bacteroidota bacterium]
KRRLLTTDLDPARHDAAVNDPSPAPATAPAKMSVDAIKKAALQLSEGYRVVLSLYLFEGYDHEEIAQILDISVGTSKSQYSRAKKRLAAILNEQK